MYLACTFRTLGMSYELTVDQAGNPVEKMLKLLDPSFATFMYYSYLGEADCSTENQIRAANHTSATQTVTAKGDRVV
jgi:hypothetical protein